MAAGHVGCHGKVSQALPYPVPLRVTGPLQLLVLWDDLDLWTLECLFRSNVIIRRALKAIQGDDCRQRRRSWLRFPWLSQGLSGTLSNSYGASAVARDSNRGHVAEV